MTIDYGWYHYGSNTGLISHLCITALCKRRISVAYEIASYTRKFGLLLSFWLAQLFL